MPRLIIDGLQIDVPEGTKVIDAAERLDIMIPRFCYLKDLGAVGACRVCAVMCLDGPVKGLQMSCMIAARDGMVISTTHEEATAFRKQVIEWLMLNHPHDCPVCDEGGQCLLQDTTISGGHGIRRHKGKKRTYRNQYLGAFIAHEMNRCIHCYRCSRFYQEYCGYRDLGVMQSAHRVYFGRFRDGQLENPFSGNLVDICPTGVYTDLPARFKVRAWDLERAPSLCIHCSLGCPTTANARYRTVWRVEGRSSETHGSAFICDRGRFGFEYTNLSQRPRQATIDHREASWENAVEAAAQRLARVRESSGPRAVAALGGVRSGLEAQVMLDGLCRAGRLPAPHYFVNPSTAAKVRAAVSHLEPDVAVSPAQVAEADCILVVGVDAINEAPMLALALRQAQRRGGDIVVLDPRPVFLPMPHVHLAVSPGDMNGAVCALIRGAVSAEDGGSGKLGSAHRELLQAVPDGFLEKHCPENRLAEVFAALQKSTRPLIVCGTEVVRESTPSLCGELALLLKEIKGRCGLFYVMPGAGAFGAGLLWEPETPSFMDLVRGMEEGSVKALLLVENDPFTQFPHEERLQKALEKLKLLVVLDHVPSRTASMAHVFLPTTTVFEAPASYINQEGRFRRAEPVHRGGIPLALWSEGGHPPRLHRDHIPGGEPRPAWQALRAMAEAMGMSGTLFQGSIFHGHAEQGKVDDGNQEDETHEKAQSEVDGPAFRKPPFSLSVQNGVPARADILVNGRPLSDGERVLSPGRDAVKFSPELLFRSIHEDADSLELLVVELTFGTEELSSHSPAIVKVEPEPHVWMHGEDAERLGLSGREFVVLHLEGGPLEVRLKVSSSMARGVLVLPRHHRLSRQRKYDTDGPEGGNDVRQRERLSGLKIREIP